MFYWGMLRHGYWLVEYLSISRLLKRAPVAYTRAFLYTETDDNDLTYFLLHQLDIISRAIADLETWLDKKTRELRSVEASIETADGVNIRQQALLAHALRNPAAIYTIQSHRRSHNVAYATARSDLLQLVDKGFLQQAKRSRAMIFSPSPQLKELLSQ